MDHKNLYLTEAYEQKSRNNSVLTKLPDGWHILHIEAVDAEGMDEDNIEDGANVAPCFDEE